MKPKSEAQSLIENPLPHELAGSAYDYGVVDKDVVLTTITYIDEEIEKLLYIINFLTDQRTELLNRAIKEGIKSDTTAVLIEKLGNLNRNPISDLEKFKAEFPGGYKLIRKNQVSDLTQKKKNIEAEIKNIDKFPITLGEADDVLGKFMVTGFVGTKPQTITYEVVKKKTYSKELK